jgi:hypothetical protein
MPQHATLTTTTDFARRPNAAQLAYALEQAQMVVQDESAFGWLRAYYNRDGGYAGSTFLTIEPNDPWQVTSSDLFAISMLNVKVGPGAARVLVEPARPGQRPA